jgi:hypothetical protein
MKRERSSGCVGWGKWNFDGVKPALMSRFKEIRRLEVNLDDYADGVKCVNNGKEEDWGRYIFRYCKCAPKQSITPGKRPMHSMNTKKSPR